ARARSHADRRDRRAKRRRTLASGAHGRRAGRRRAVGSARSLRGFAARADGRRRRAARDRVHQPREHAARARRRAASRDGGPARHREMAVRVAVGAGRFRLVRQMLTESLLLSTMGAALGLLVAYGGARSLVRIIATGRSPVGMPQQLHIPVQIDLNILLFAAGAPLATGVLFGLVPAWAP